MAADQIPIGRGHHRRIPGLPGGSSLLAAQKRCPRTFPAASSISRKEDPLLPLGHPGSAHRPVPNPSRRTGRPSCPSPPSRLPKDTGIHRVTCCDIQETPNATSGLVRTDTHSNSPTSPWASRMPSCVTTGCSGTSSL